MYQATDLPTTASLGFPSALPPLKSAMATAEQMISCSGCLTDVAAFKQNGLLSISLLGSIASGFDKLLRAIDSEASRSKTNGSKLVLTLGDRSAVNAHRHTFTKDCPAAFELELDGDEWHVLTKRIVFKELNDTPGNRHRTLKGLVKAAEERQRIWHRSRHFAEENEDRAHNLNPDDCTVFKLTGEVRRQIDRFMS